MSKEKELPKYPRHPHAHASGGFVFNDPKELEEQRGVLWDMAKQVAGGITTGKFDIINISFPVRIFEPRSYLERITDGWCFMPALFAQAAATTDPVQRLEFVITMALAGLHNTCKQKKPFNPILGETFQGKYEDGTEVFCEQSSHHPPVTNWMVIGPESKWRFYGYGQWQASFSVNSVSGGQRGAHYVEFADGTKIKYNLPDMVLGGMLMGERIMQYLGQMVFEDAKNNLRAEISIPPPAEQASGWFSGWFAAKPPSDYFRGAIYRLSPDGGRTAVSQLEGAWLGAVLINGKTVWDVTNPPKLETPARVDNPLPSDARFREDCVHLARGEMEKAGEWKKTLEERQRRDRALRKAAKEKKHGAAAAAAVH